MKMSADSIIVLTVVLTFIIAVCVHNVRETSAIEKAISEGVDPLEVSCAYDAMSYCDILASK